jgi:CPA1 family monovalent cation:H+ antiporter
MRWLGLANAGWREQHVERVEEFRARRRGIEAAIERLDLLAKDRQLPEELVRSLREYHRDRLRRVEHRSDGDAHYRRITELTDHIGLLLIGAEREMVNNLFYLGELNDEARRRIERGLDLNEAYVAALEIEE